MTLVVDASALVDLAVGGSHAPALERHLAASRRLLAPDLVGLEVVSALWRLVRSGEMRLGEAEEARTALRRSAVRRLPLEPVEDEAWSLRDRLRLSDAFYAAWATRLRLPLLTTDGRFARAAVPGLEVLLVS